MSRRTSRNEYRRSQWIIAAVYLTLIGVLSLATASADEGVRSATSQQFQGDRDSRGDAITTNDSYAPLVSEGVRVRPGQTAQKAEASASGRPRTARASTDDFWIFDADVIVFGDDDNDGYFFGIDLEFDADTVFSSAAVYAALYLSLEGGPWNEYAVTEDFLIEGAVGSDAYGVVTELQSGYPAGDYDLLIELYDADTGEFLTDFGPESSSALALLPLEDFNRDAPGFDTRVTISRGGGGGSLQFVTLVTLLLAWTSRAARRYRRERQLALRA